MGDCAFDEAVQRAYTLGRNALQSEKVRPLGLRTYRPFRGQLQDAKPTFMEMVEIVEEVIDEIGMPMAPKSRGRRRKYDWKQILVARNGVSCSCASRSFLDTRLSNGLMLIENKLNKTF